MTNATAAFSQMPRLRRRRDPATSDKSPSLTRGSAKVWGFSGLVRYVGIAIAVLTACYLAPDVAHSLVYSATALAMSFVMATKEMIVCVFGGLVRSGTRILAVGDLVEIGSVRGTVQRTGIFMTRLLEVDDFGDTDDTARRTISIPNGRFFEDCVIVRSGQAQFVLSRFVLAFDPSRSMREIADWWDMRATVRPQLVESTDGDALLGYGAIATTFATNAMAKPCVHVTLRSTPADSSMIQRALTIEFYDWLTETGQQLSDKKYARPRSAEVILELVS